MNRLVGVCVTVFVVFSLAACMKLKPGRCNHDTDCQTGLRCNLDPTPQGNGRCVPIAVGDGGDARSDADAGTEKPSDGASEKPDALSPCTATCSGTTPICDSTSKVCRTCSGSTECAAINSAAPICAASGACVECETGGQCGTPGKPICEGTPGMCRACASGTECMTRNLSTPVCAASGVCVECGMSSQCDAAAKPICDATSNACRACGGGGECAARDAKLPACATSGKCVECLASADCKVTGKPVCDPGMNTCRACQADSECPADPGVCMTDGHCAASGEVIFVEFNASGCPNADGSSAKPYCLPNDGVAALTNGRHVIVIRGAAGDRMIVATTAKGPIVIGRKSLAGDVGSIPAGAGSALTVFSDDVLVRDLTINGGTASGSKGLVTTGASTKLTLVRVAATLGTGLGVDAEGGATLTMDQCYVENNSVGGILVNGAKYGIQNSVIAGNGGTSGYGVQFTASAISAGSQFWFNTIANNPIAATCDLNNAQTINASIVSGPVASCNVLNSLATAPSFDATRPYHLTAHHGCLSVPGTFPDHDVDGDPRTSPPDCGADQYVP